MHERFRELLLDVAADRGAEPCAWSPASPILNFGMPDDKAIQVFLPDMHILTKARRAVYSYGLNHEAMLEDVLARLIQLKVAAADDRARNRVPRRRLSRPVARVAHSRRSGCRPPDPERPPGTGHPAGG